MRTCPQCQRAYSDDADFCLKDGTPLPAVPGVTEAALAGGLARRYRIVKKLGSGGMGSVFHAEQITLGNRPVALKVLSRRLLDDPEFLLRFNHEGASTARIRHANVVTIYESGQADDGTPYIAMEYLEGESLRDALQNRGALPVAECAEILQQTARGLNAAHKLGIIHRDLKPDNIFLTRGDEGELIVKVVDFGIAKMRESATHTMTGLVLGTPAYMSCEQASGMRSDDLDGRSDLYSLGVVTYEMLTGRVPFHSDTPLGYVRKHMLEEPPPFRAAAPGLPVSPQVEAVVMRALAKDRDQRYASVTDFAREFARAAVAPAQFPVGSPRPDQHVMPQSERSSNRDQPFVLRPASPVAHQAEVAVQTPPPLMPSTPVGRPPDVGAVREPPFRDHGARPVAERRSALPAQPQPSPLDVGPVREPPLAGYGASPLGEKNPQLKLFVLLAAVLMVVAAVVWYNWPSGSNGGNQQVPAPTVSRPQSQPEPPNPQPVVRLPSAGSRQDNPARPVDPAEVRKKVNAALTAGDSLYDDGQYDRAIAAYDTGLAADPGNAQLRQRIQKVTAAKAADNSVPR